MVKGRIVIEQRMSGMLKEEIVLEEDQVGGLRRGTI